MKLLKVTSYDLLNALKLNEWRTVAEICTKLGKKHSDLESLAEVGLLIQIHTKEGHLEFELDEVYVKSNVRLKREGLKALSFLEPSNKTVVRHQVR